MRLLGTKTEKSHSLYLIIYQVFKSIFSIENETLRLFSQKKLFHVRENYYPLDSIKEGADEPVANDTCKITNESNHTNKSKAHPPGWALAFNTKTL